MDIIFNWLLNLLLKYEIILPDNGIVGTKNGDI